MSKPDNLHDLWARFERMTLLTTSPSTFRRYSHAVENFFRKFPDITDYHDFTRNEMEEYKILRLRDGVSPNTINFEMKTVKTFWRWLKNSEFIAHNPMDQVKTLKKRDTERKGLTFEEQTRLYDVAKDIGKTYEHRIQNRLLVALALTTGLRGETLIALTKDDVDWENKALRIPGDKMKTGRALEIPLREDVLELIERVPSQLLFQGFAETVPSLGYRWNVLLRRAQISSRGIRLARRTFATTLLRRGVDLGIVKDLMGHQNISTTSRYVTPAEREQVRDALTTLPTPGLKSLNEDT